MIYFCANKFKYCVFPECYVAEVSRIKLVFLFRYKASGIMYMVTQEADNE